MVLSKIKQLTKIMKTKNNSILRQNKIFIWIAIATLLLLSIPLLLMTLKIPLYDPGSGYEVINWDLTDFIVMGVLIFSTCSLFAVTARKIQKKSHRIALTLAFLLGFIWLWAELAVGIFTNLGN